MTKKEYYKLFTDVEKHPICEKNVFEIAQELIDWFNTHLKIMELCQLKWYNLN